MADSDALRSRRKRLHAAGDCSLCRHDGRGVLTVLPAPADAGDDPVAALRALAGRLTAAHEASPGDAAVARVLKDVLLALRGGQAPPASAGDDPLKAARDLARSVP